MARQKVLSALVCLALAAAAPDAAQSRDTRSEPERVEDVPEILAALVTSNQITFRKDGEGFAPVCYCGPKIYLHNIPPSLRNAVVAIEDRRFFEHKGIDPIGIGRGFIRGLTGRIEGGSTITQQLVKNTVLTPKRSLARKLAEAELARTLEQRLGKHQILVAYLNQMVFAHIGQPLVGVEQAARHFFGRTTDDLNLYESAVLAGMLKAPSRYNPLKWPQRAKARAKLVLAAMVRNGDISKAQMRSAIRRGFRKRGPLEPFAFESRNFVQWVLAAVRRRHLAFSPGPSTRIPITLQVLSQRAVERALHRSTPNTRRLGGEYAFVTMAHDGRVVVMVGQRDFATRPYNLAVAARRQPASTFKPFVYLAALEHKRSPPFAAVRSALATSDNDLPQRLIGLLGADAVIRTASKMGFSSDLRNDNSLALGSSEVSLLELTAAYGTFASGGLQVRPYGHLAVVNAGRVLSRRMATPAKRVAKRNHVQVIHDGLKAVVSEGTARHADLPPHTAGKTGTSDGNRDAWFVGYNGRRVSGLWLGRPDNLPLGRITGSDAAAVWAEVDRSLATVK